MKTINIFLLFLGLSFSTFSCDNIQESVVEKTRELQETAEKKINDQMEKVDSTLNKLDTKIQAKVDSSLNKLNL